MTNISACLFSRKIRFVHLLALLVMAVAPAMSLAQLEERHSVEAQGAVVQIGNQLLDCVSGTCTNNNGNMQPVDVAPVGGGAPDNSSTADLNLPIGISADDIEIAKLYWGGQSPADDYGMSSAGTIYLRAPGGAYQQIRADDSGRDGHLHLHSGDTNNRRAYMADADITDIVKNALDGTYAVGGASLSTGAQSSGLGFYGGWAIIVIYRDENEPFRRMMLFDGDGGNIAGTTSETIGFSGILTPPQGEFSAALGALVWEGDRGITGDRFRLTGPGVINPGDLSDAASPADNFWNSGIANFGVNNTDRNPAPVNNYAIDLKMVDVSNSADNSGPQLANTPNPGAPNAGVEADLEFSTTGDAFFPHAVSFMTELFRPEVIPTLDKTAVKVGGSPGPNLHPGDIIEYAIEFHNQGKDGAIRVAANDPIPLGLTYVPGSMELVRDDGNPGNTGPQSDGVDGDLAEFVASDGPRGTIYFRVGDGATGGNISSPEGGLLLPNEKVIFKYRAEIHPDFLDDPATFPDSTITNRIIISHGSQTFPNDPDQNVEGEVEVAIEIEDFPPVQLVKSASPSAIPDQAGQTVEFSLIAYNYESPVTEVDFSDTLPTGWSYDTGSTTITLPNGTTVTGTAADPTVAGQQLDWNLDESLNPFEVISIRFSATTSAAPGGDSVNNATVTALDFNNSPVSSDADAIVGITDLALAKTANVSEAGPNDTITYTVTLENTGTVRQTDIDISDTLAQDTTYVPESTVATGYIVSGGDYLDGFEGISFSGSNGSMLWTNPWVENDTGASQSPTDGDIQVVGGNDCPDGRCLRIQPGDTSRHVYRAADLTLPQCQNQTVTLSYDYNNQLSGGFGSNPAIDAELLYTGGSTSTAVGNFTSNNNTGSGTVTHTLAPAEVTADTRIRFNVTNSSGSGSLYVDNVRFECGDTTPAAGSKDNDAASASDDLVYGSAPILVVPSDNFVLDPGQTMEVTYQVTVDAQASGELINKVSATSTENPDAVDASATVLVPNPALELSKSGQEQSDGSITYTFTVENTGNVTLTNVVVDDAQLGISGLAVTPSTLAPGQTGTATFAGYVPTQAELDAGEVLNTASATGTDPGSNPISDDDTEITPLTQSPSLLLSKAGVLEVGGTVTYTFEVKNTGNVTLTNVGIDDAQLGISGLAVTPSTLAPGQTGTATFTGYVPTQAERDAGEVVNTATATGTDPGNATVTGDATEITPLPRNPSIALSKSGAEQSDGSITYTFTIENTGNVTLANVEIDDAQLGISGLAVTPSTLAPGQTGTATFTGYVPTQAERDAGEVVNTATATGQDPDNNDVTGSDTETTPVAQNPGIELDKQVTSSGPYEVGTDIEYSFTVTNTGDVTLTDVVVNDPLLGGAVSCSPDTLAPSETATCGPGTYTITQADVDSGGVTNTATVTGQDPDDVDVTDSDSTSTDLDRDPDIELIKEVTSTGDYGLGSEIEYTITATNTGNVTLFDVEISDPLLGTLDCSPDQPADLAPDEELVCEGSYTVTQDDVDAGEVVNVATVNAEDPEDNDVPEEVEVTTPVDQNPAIRLDKAVTSSGPYTVGSNIEYTFTVENTGDVTLTNIEVDDPLLGGAISCSPDTLAPSETATCGPVDYTVTQGDVNSGFVHNEATVTGQDPDDNDVTGEDETTTNLDQNPGISLDKAVTSSGPYGLNDTISYEITATNTGDVDLYNVVVEDVLLTPSTATCATVAPADTCVLTGTYTVTQDDVDAGEVHNVATVDAEDPEGNNVPEEDEVTTPIDQTPGISLDKRVTSSAPFDVGDDIDYEITAINTGNVTLFDVEISDPLLGALDCAPAQPADLAPGDELVCEGSYTVTQDDVNDGEVVNTATVSGSDPNDDPVEAEDSITTPVDQAPAIELVKSVTTSGPYWTGDIITYEFTVENTGNVPLTDVEVDDPLLGGIIACVPDALDPGETASCGPADYTVTSADVGDGEVVNTATAYGTPPVADPSDPPVEVSADDTVNTVINGKPPIPVPAVGWGGLLILLAAFSLVGWRRLRT